MFHPFRLESSSTKILFTGSLFLTLRTLPGHTASTKKVLNEVKCPENKFLIYKMQTTKTSKYFQVVDLSQR